MIGFRHGDPAFPFLWEDASQPAARWHAEGDGPAHYIAETPDGAWAEFLRHEGITDPSDLDGIERGMWAIELREPPAEPPAALPALPLSVLTGGLDSYASCQQEATRLRDAGATGLVAPSAALVSGTASGWRTERGLRPGVSRDERVIVLFGPRPDLVGWSACNTGRPRADLLPRVRQFETDE